MSKRPLESGFTLIEVLVVIGLIGVVSVMAFPMFDSTMAGFRLSGNARSLSNSVAVAKMRAASKFSRVRLYADLTARTHRLEAWDKDLGVWSADGGTTYLSQGVSFSYGIVANAPLNTQTTIGQATQCFTDLDVVIANTACVIFNSRGVPVVNVLPVVPGAPVFVPTGDDALYLTDGTNVYAITVAATGMVKMWRTPPRATPTWVVS